MCKYRLRPEGKKTLKNFGINVLTILGIIIMYVLVGLGYRQVNDITFLDMGVPTDNFNQIMYLFLDGVVISSLILVTLGLIVLLWLWVEVLFEFLFEKC